MYAQEISAFKICGVVPWRGSLRNIILLHTHTHTHTPHFLKTSLKTFLFTSLAFHTWHFSCVTVGNREWPNFVECCSSLQS